MHPPTASAQEIYPILERQLGPRKTMYERLSYFFYHGLTKTTVSESVGGLGFNVAVICVVNDGTFMRPKRFSYHTARGVVDGEEWATAISSCSSKGLLEHLAEADEHVGDKTAIDARLKGKGTPLRIDVRASPTIRNMCYGSPSDDRHFILDPREDVVADVMKSRGVYVGDVPYGAVAPIGERGSYFGVVVVFNPYSREEVSKNLEALRGLWRKKGNLLQDLRKPEKKKAAVEDLAKVLSMSKQELAMLARNGNGRA